MTICKKTVLKFVISMAVMLMILIFAQLIPSYAADSHFEKNNLYQTKTFGLLNYGIQKINKVNNFINDSISYANKKYGGMQYGFKNKNFEKSKTNADSGLFDQTNVKENGDTSLFGWLKNRIVNKIERIENRINQVKVAISNYSPFQFLKRLIWSRGNLGGIFKNINTNFS